MYVNLSVKNNTSLWRETNNAHCQSCINFNRFCSSYIVKLNNNNVFYLFVYYNIESYNYLSRNLFLYCILFSWPLNILVKREIRQLFVTYILGIKLNSQQKSWTGWVEIDGDVPTNPSLDLKWLQHIINHITQPHGTWNNDTWSNTDQHTQWHESHDSIT